MVKNKRPPRIDGHVLKRCGGAGPGAAKGGGRPILLSRLKPQLSASVDLEEVSCEGASGASGAVSFSLLVKVAAGAGPAHERAGVRSSA